PRSDVACHTIGAGQSRALFLPTRSHSTEALPTSGGVGDWHFRFRRTCARSRMDTHPCAVVQCDRLCIFHYARMLLGWHLHRQRTREPAGRHAETSGRTTNTVGTRPFCVCCSVGRSYLPGTKLLWHLVVGLDRRDGGRIWSSKHRGASDCGRSAYHGADAVARCDLSTRG